MRRVAVVLPLICLPVAAFGAIPASAAPGRIDVHAAGYNDVIGTGVLAVTGCTAHTNVDLGWVATETTVSCTVNGYPSDVRTTPGTDSAVVVVDATLAPVTVCVSASAVLTSPLSQPVTVIALPTCFLTPAGVYG